MMRHHLRRRDALALLGSAAASSFCPRMASAQQRPIPVLGILQAGSATARNPNLDAFLKGVAEGGYVEGRNLAIAYRYADGQASRLPALAGDLVNRGVAAIAGLGGSAPALAAKAATATIPIVFAAPQNPAELGLVESIE